MNIDDRRRVLLIKWLLTLPKGENDTLFEKAVENARNDGMTEKEIIEFLNVSFITELNDFIKWTDMFHSSRIS
jgi:hypothetical protein